MYLNSLKPAKGSTKASKRVGRGIGSGLGKTAGRGHKGQKSRSGGSVRAGFEGGQMPLLRRLPKRGFSNHLFRKDFQIVNLSTLELLKLKKIDASKLAEKGVVKSAFDPIKILGNGDLTKAIEISASAFSKTAIEKIEKAGGKAILQ